jgi:hypothetical protein
MRRYRAPSTALGTFFVVQFSADCTTNMSGFDLRQAQAMTPENAIHACIGDGDGVIARQIPDDAYWPQAVGFPQIQHLLDDLWSRSIGRILRSCLAVFEARQAVLPIGSSPANGSWRPTPKYRQALPTSAILSACWSTRSLWSTSRRNLCIPVILPALEAEEKGCLVSSYIPTIKSPERYPET